MVSVVLVDEHTIIDTYDGKQVPASERYDGFHSALVYRTKTLPKGAKSAAYSDVYALRVRCKAY
jgi:hypothetical protein